MLMWVNRGPQQHGTTFCRAAEPCGFVARLAVGLGDVVLQQIGFEDFQGCMVHYLGARYKATTWPAMLRNP